MERSSLHRVRMHPLEGQSETGWQGLGRERGHPHSREDDSGNRRLITCGGIDLISQYDKASGSLVSQCQKGYLYGKGEN